MKFFTGRSLRSFRFFYTAGADFGLEPRKGLFYAMNPTGAARLVNGADFVQEGFVEDVSGVGRATDGLVVVR